MTGVEAGLDLGLGQQRQRPDHRGADPATRSHRSSPAHRQWEQTLSLSTGSWSYGDLDLHLSVARQRRRDPWRPTSRRTSSRRPWSAGPSPVGSRRRRPGSDAVVATSSNSVVPELRPRCHPPESEPLPPDPAPRPRGRRVVRARHRRGERRAGLRRRAPAGPRPQARQLGGGASPPTASNNYYDLQFTGLSVVVPTALSAGQLDAHGDVHPGEPGRPQRDGRARPTDGLGGEPRRPAVRPRSCSPTPRRSTAGTEVQVQSGIYVGGELPTSVQTGTYVVTAQRSRPPATRSPSPPGYRAPAVRRCSKRSRARWSRGAGSSVHGVAAPARITPSRRVSSARSDDESPWASNTTKLSPRVASSTTERPDAVMVARTTRRSVSRRERSTYPCFSSRSTALVTEVG